MQIMVNGRAQDVSPGETVAGLLERLEMSGRPCAVEVNRDLVPQREHAGRELREGDAVELVTLVGGG